MCCRNLAVPKLSCSCPPSHLNHHTSEMQRTWQKRQGNGVQSLQLIIYLSIYSLLPKYKCRTLCNTISIVERQLSCVKRPSTVWIKLYTLTDLKACWKPFLAAFCESIKVIFGYFWGCGQPFCFYHTSWSGVWDTRLFFCGGGGGWCWWRCVDSGNGEGIKYSPGRPVVASLGDRSMK